MTQSNYKQLVLRKKVKVLQRGCLNTPALADFSSFPERFRRVMENVFGDPKLMKTTNPLDDYLGQDTKAMEFYSSYEVDDNRYLPAETIKEYYANACVLNAIHLLLKSRRSLQKMCGGTVKAYWPTIAQNVMDFDRSIYPHSLPLNDRRLKDRYNQYQKGGYEILIHKNFCNKNSAKVDDDVKESVIIGLLADPRNFDNAQVAREYNKLCQRLEWQPITPAAVAQYRKKYDTMIYARRRGMTNFMNKKTMQVKRSKPTCPLYFWTIDGWDVELMYQATVTDKKTNYTRTTYHNRPTMVTILDPCTNYPVGYAIGDKENPELIKAALRNAIHHTKELWGEMYQVHQMQSDNYGRGALKPYYEAMCDKYTPAQVHNAKAKVIEPWFKYFNKKHCQPESNWSGFGVTSQKESQPNGDLLNKYRKDFPDYDGVVAMVIEKLEIERALKIDEYMAKWEATPADDKVILAADRYLMNFGKVLSNDKTGKKTTVMLQDNGLKVTIDGFKREYDCFDVTMRDHYSVQWEIRYDPTDLSKVMAVNADETLRYMLEEKYVQPMALKDRKQGDSGQLQKVKEFNQFQKDRNAEFYQKQYDNLVEIMPVMRELDTLQKLMICDSHGQHKDRRNDGRTSIGSAAKALRSRATTVEAEDEETDFRNLY
jgi:hypothetical protein